MVRCFSVIGMIVFRLGQTNADALFAVVGFIWICRLVNLRVWIGSWPFSSLSNCYCFVVEVVVISRLVCWIDSF